MNKNFILATGLLSGTIIGAGIFSLPYVVSRLGILTGFFYLAAFAAVYAVIHLMYARLVDSVPETHEFFYLAKKHLPKFLSGFASFAILCELVFVLTVYLILAPSFSELAFGVGGSSAIFGFWLIGSIFIFARLTLRGLAELSDIFIIFIIGAVLFWASGNLIPEVSLVNKLTLPLFFLPFGPLLFSLSGRPALADVVAEHRKAQTEGSFFSLKKAIVLGTVLPAILYLIFALGVLSLNPEVTPEALNSLQALPPYLLKLLGIMGLITLWTSYFMIGADLREIFRSDLRLPGWLSGFLVLGMPIGLYFAGFKNFFEAISFTGGVFLGLEAIFIVMMWRRAFPSSSGRKFSPILYLIFLTAVIYEIYSFVI